VAAHAADQVLHDAHADARAFDAGIAHERECGSKQAAQLLAAQAAAAIAHREPDHAALRLHLADTTTLPPSRQ
jgi:hypothetical protein